MVQTFLFRRFLRCTTFLYVCRRFFEFNPDNPINRGSDLLSPDNYIQNPTNAQNYNRYSYCLNNPLKYTDPSGNEYQYRTDFFGAFAVGMGGENWGSGGGATAMFGRGNYFAGADAYFGSFYKWDAHNGVYRNGNGDEVSWDEVYNEYVLPNGSTTTNPDIINGMFLYYNSTQEQLTASISKSLGSSKISPKEMNQILQFRVFLLFGIQIGDYGIVDIRIVTQLGGYTYDKTVESLKNSTSGSYVDGVTRRVSRLQQSIISLSPCVLNQNDPHFIGKVGHEIIHAFHYYNIPYEEDGSIQDVNFNKKHSEYVCYTYTAAIYDIFGMTIEALNELGKRNRFGNQTSNFNINYPYSFPREIKGILTFYNGYQYLKK